MAELFKDLYSDNFFEVLIEVLELELSGFDKERFLTEVYDSDWDSMELKKRMHHITHVIKGYLPNSYAESVEQLLGIISALKAADIENRVKYAGLVFLFIPNYIEQYGIDEFDVSVPAFETITQFTSCEFAVRPFIIRYGDKMMNEIMKWTKHENEHVRRLASEGSRSRLPWGMAILAFKNDPKPVIPILEVLKSDESEYVRRSVANNLNDISKDTPQVVIDIAKRWLGESKDTDWIIKHACRTMLKAGNQDVMQLFGYGSANDIDILDFKLTNGSVKIGGELEFEFTICNRSEKSEKVRLEYGVYYLKQNGTLSKKVYKISEKVYGSNTKTDVVRRQSFKQISTRRFYEGVHQVSIIVNGVEFDVLEFELIK